MFRHAIIFLGMLLAASCRPSPDAQTIEPAESAWPAFLGESAYDEAVNLTSLGSRAQGSAGNTHAAHYIMARLGAMGLQPSFILFTNQTPVGNIVFRNITTVLPGRADGMILLTTHYDSLFGAPEDFEAANSAASGPAVLLEAARVLKEGYDGNGPEIRLVFFDGQEPLNRHSPGDGLRGSRHYAARLKQSGLAETVIAVINLDMVGDRDLNLTIPRNTSSSLRRKLLAAASREGFRSYFSLYPAEIGDDHDPFLELGISAVNLIDFQFGSGPGRNDYWRTTEDTMEKISAESLEITGRVTLRLIRDLFPDR